MKVIYILLIALFTTQIAFSQSLDMELSQKDMYKDLEVFKKIREDANSGLYKYRNKEEIDSIYQWAKNEVKNSNTFRDFYTIISKLTDFEGSLHNGTSIPKKIYKAMRQESHGYFPYPIKLIEGKVLMNLANGEIPLASEIISINGEKIESVLSNFYKYYTTDGFNMSGKVIGINYHFARYYRWYYGLQTSFEVDYMLPNSSKTQKISLKSLSYLSYYKNLHKRHSLPFDKKDYKEWKVEEMYTFENIDKFTALLTIKSFAIGGDAKAKEHLKYVAFLDSVFSKMKENKTQNLIVDIRGNGGGTDPNDLVTYSYLTDRNFAENKEAWVSFQKIPNLKYIVTKVPTFLRPLGVIKYNKYFRKEFPVKKGDRYYQDSSSADHTIRTANKNAFTGNVFLLISPNVASAASLFAAMLAGNKNTLVIGEETMGGYYGHNGHTPLGYILPKSKIKTFFSIVNLEQDVPQKENQIYHRGIIPDHKVSQDLDDYLNNVDTQMNFTLDLIKKNK